MANVLINEESLTNIASAIREKNGETTTYKPGDMALAISNIQSITPPTTGFVPTAWKKSGNNQQIGLITEGIWYGTLTQAAFATNPPDYVYNGPFGYLQNIIFANEITMIANYAFYQCKALALTSLPDSVTDIRSYAFYKCTSLALTSLPAGLKQIGDYAFEGCSSLAITKIPNQVTEIAWCAFSKCTSLSELTFEGDITTIEANALASCSALAKIVFPNITSVPVLDSTNAFSSTPISKATGYIYVPDSLVESFKTATNWSAYADQIRPISDLDNLIDLSNQTFPVTLDEGITVDYDASTTSITFNGTITGSCGFNIPITQELIGNYTLSYTPAETNRGFYISIDNNEDAMLNGWGSTEKTFTLTEQPSQLMFWFDYSDSTPERNTYENYTIKLKLIKNEEGSSE